MEETPTVYHVFWGDRCYPYGGMDDYQGAYSSLDEAVALVETNLGVRFGPDWANIAVIDKKSNRLVKVWDSADAGY